MNYLLKFVELHYSQENWEEQTLAGVTRMSETCEAATPVPSQSAVQLTKDSMLNWLSRVRRSNLKSVHRSGRRTPYYPYYRSASNTRRLHGLYLTYSYSWVIDHREAAWFIISVDSVCLSVCQTTTFESLILSQLVYLQTVWVKFVYEGHWVKVKVTGAKLVKNAYSRNVNFSRP